MLGRQVQASSLLAELSAASACPELSTTDQVDVHILFIIVTIIVLINALIIIHIILVILLILTIRVKI